MFRNPSPMWFLMLHTIEVFVSTYGSWRSVTAFPSYQSLWDDHCVHAECAPLEVLNRCSLDFPLHSLHCTSWQQVGEINLGMTLLSIPMWNLFVLSRYTCLVCKHRPTFDTIAMLTVHRTGQKHARGMKLLRVEPWSISQPFGNYFEPCQWYIVLAWLCSMLFQGKPTPQVASECSV